MAKNGVLEPEKMALIDRAAHYHGLREWNGTYRQGSSLSWS